MKSVGFESVAGHPCLFIRQSTGAYCIIVITVTVFFDDLIVCGENDEDIEHLKKLMNEKFALTNGGNLDYYQGAEFEFPDDMNLVMHQRGYAENLLKKFGMKDANLVKLR